MSLFSVVGVLSASRILSAPDNLVVDKESVQLNINKLEPNASINMTFNNRGAFDITAVNYTLKVRIIQKPEYVVGATKEYGIMSKTVSDNTFPAQMASTMLFMANKSDFSYPFPDATWDNIRNEEFNFYLMIEIEGLTNLGLVRFVVDFSYDITGGVAIDV